MSTSLIQDPARTHLETELLLCCARTCMDAATADRVRRLLREDINWEYVTQIARWHGILPLLSTHLFSTCPEGVPRATLEQLQLFLRVNAVNNSFLTHELLKLLALFEAHNIPAMPYKGPVLAATAYGNLALRQFSDLDLLIHQQDVLRVKDLLVSEGYQPWRQLTAAQEAAHLQSFHAYTFVRDDGRLSVDLHWRFAQRASYVAFPLDLERLWDRLEPLCLAGTRVLNLPPEELLLILCVHGAKDGWTRLKWICDIGELVRVHQGLNWQQVMEQARRLHSERMLFLGLLLASDLLSATLPEDILQRVQGNPVVSRLARQVRKQLFSETVGAFNVMTRHALHLRLMECSQDRISYVLYYLREMVTPNARDQVLLRLPTALSFFHYMLRPIRLVHDYGPALLQSFLRRFP